MSVNDTSIVQRKFEGAGATILFTQGNSQKVVFAHRNPDYIKNDKKMDECEYPGGKVDEDDYKQTNTDEEAALYAVKREWDEEVFSLFTGNSEMLRSRSAQLFADFVTSEEGNFVDIQGGKSTIRLFMPQINLDLKINDYRDMLYSNLKHADRVLEEAYNADKMNTPLTGIVTVELKDLVSCLKKISNETEELEKNLSGGKLMKAIGPVCAKYPLKFTRMHSGDTIERSIRKFNFFTLRALMMKKGFWNVPQ